jgi:hypothetical protein
MMGLERAGFPMAQVNEDCKEHITTSPVVSVELE